MLRTGRLSTLFLLRGVMIIALALLFYLEAGDDFGVILLQSGGAALAILILSNLLLQTFERSLTRWPGFPLLLAAMDSLLTAMVIFSVNVDAAEILFLVAVVILLTALGNDMKRTVACALAVGGIYCWMMLNYRSAEPAMIGAYLARMTLLYTVALYFGHMVVDARQQKERVDRADRENHELRTILDILETATSSHDLHRLMQTIVARLGEVIATDRCSILFLDRSPERGWVIASSESPEVDMLPLDLRKYPEVQRAISIRCTVLIDDVERHPLMDPVREHIRSATFSSLLVIPLVYQEEILGALLLRAARSKSVFGHEEIRFCQVVAGATVSALKNALLNREVRQEAEKHRSTNEKLRNILENSMEIIVATDPEGKITDFNRLAETTLGYTREEVLGRPITELLGRGEARRDFLARLRRAGTVLEETADVRRGDGNPVKLNLTFAAVRNDLGEMVGSVCVGKEPGEFN